MVLWVRRKASESMGCVLQFTCARRLSNSPFRVGPSTSSGQRMFTPSSRVSRCYSLWGRIFIAGCLTFGFGFRSISRRTRHRCTTPRRPFLICNNLCDFLTPKQAVVPLCGRNMRRRNLSTCLGSSLARGPGGNHAIARSYYQSRGKGPLPALDRKGIPWLSVKKRIWCWQRGRGTPLMTYRVAPKLDA
jgi:hypothetical protein